MIKVYHNYYLLVQFHCDVICKRGASSQYCSQSMALLSATPLYWYMIDSWKRRFIFALTGPAPCLGTSSLAAVMRARRKLCFCKLYYYSVYF